MNKLKKCALALLLLLALFAFTGCDSVAPTDTISYAESRTAAVFASAKTGRVKVDFTTTLMSRKIDCSLVADQSRQVAQIHAVRNSYNMYQRDDSKYSYTIDVGKYQEYTKESRRADGVLNTVKALTGGVSKVKIGYATVNDKSYYCETLQNDDVTVVCCFEGSTLKYIKLRVLGSESMGTVSNVTYTVSDAELNIPDFPEKYKEVTSLKAKQDLWKKFFG